MTSRLIVALLALVVLAAGCGGDEAAERATGASDAGALLRETAANTAKLRSGTLRLELRGGAGGAVSLRGPFTVDREGRLPRFAFAAKLQSGGSTVSTGATWTGEKGYVALQGTSYEISPLLMGQVAAGYEQAFKGGGALVLGGVDFTKWIRSPRNLGPARVGGVETIKIGGAADAARVLADLDTLAAQAGALSLPGVGGRMPRLSGPDRRAAAAAVRSLEITVYTGASDRVLRRLVVTGEVERRPLALDLTFTGVGKDQTIAAPADARPFSELLELFEASGAGGLGSMLGKDPGRSGTPNKVDRYAACIEEADGDRAKARRCAELLTG